MLMKRYEYLIKDADGEGNKRTYVGSYTIKADCPNDEKLQKQFNSVLVQTFEH